MILYALVQVYNTGNTYIHAYVIVSVCRYVIFHYIPLISIL